jgi:hypothetical protein
MYGGVGKLMDWRNVRISFRHNAIQFENHPVSKLGRGSITLGNTMSHEGSKSDSADFGSEAPRVRGPVWQHEIQHTYQGQHLGPAYLPSNLLGMAVDLVIHGAGGAGFGPAHGPANWNERGPESYPPRPWR